MRKYNNLFGYLVIKFNFENNRTVPFTRHFPTDRPVSQYKLRKQEH